MKNILAIAFLLFIQSMAYCQHGDLETFGSSWSAATRGTLIVFGIVSILLALRTFRNKPDV